MTDVAARPSILTVRSSLRTARRLVGFVVVSLCAVLVGFGALSMMSVAGTPAYDQETFAIGSAGLFAGAAIGIALLLLRVRLLRKKLADYEDRIETLSDTNWELRETEERTRCFFEAQGDAIIRRDLDGTVSFANESYCALAGRDRDAIVGTHFQLNVTADGEVLVCEDGTRIYDQKIATPTGERWIAWREATLRLGHQGLTAVQSVGRDITERARSEHMLGEARDAAQAANRAKSRFLAMVSHEIRTPLNGLLGMSDLLIDTPLTAEQMTYVNAVKTSGGALLSLIEDVLDFSKIEAGHLALDRKPFSPTALVEEVIELLAPRAQAKGLEIASDLDDDLPALVLGDAARLRQVLLNLVGNAIKFTEQGGVSLTAACDGDGLVFRVRDTGVGIAPEDQDRIFTEFAQADEGTARRFGGTGLGLAITKRIVAQMQGRIAVTSTPGDGACFVLWLDLPRADDATAQAAKADRVDLSGKTVLIVSSGCIESHLLAHRLTAWGAAACIIVDEHEAQVVLPERDWDMLFIDHAVGTDHAVRLFKAGRAIPQRVVMIEPAARAELDGLRRAGATRFLVKPLRRATLAAIVASHLPPSTEADRDIGSVGAVPDKALSILVVEDNDINALLARALLDKLGHRPTIVRDGAQGLESWMSASAAGNPYDLVLMDIHMPGMDGLEAARRIRAAEAENGGAHTPIIALSADAVDREQGGCRAAGMDGFLTKPLDRDRLAAILKN